MNESNKTPREPFESGRWLRVGALAATLGFAAFLRFDGLGARSLWADEFCTWRVSRMPPGESLRWGPELTKPPLYQLCLRAISADEKLSEKTLRLPATISGVLAVIVVWWIASIAGGWTTGCAGALLLACNDLQIDYSQEARSYSMLMLGSALSTGLWHQLNVKKSKSQNVETSRDTRNLRMIAAAYVVVTVLAFHAHYLMLLTVAAQAAWWVLIRLPIADCRSAIDEGPRARRRRGLAGPIAMVAAGLFCVPIVWHYMRYRTSVFQGLDWIAPPTWGDTVTVLEKLTFGPVWLWGLLAPAVLAVAVAMVKTTGMAEEGASGTHPTNPDGVRSLTVAALFRRAIAGPNDLCGLLLCWLGAAWFGLMVISWLAHPAMVARYALPAAVPAILLPLIVAHRIDARGPLVIATVFFAASAGRWTSRSEKVMPGFREMVEFLDEVVDPDREAVVLAIERTTSPGWEEMDRLGFEYYPLRRGEVRELHLRGGEPDGDQPILRDPRALYLVTFLGDPEKAIESAGREMARMRIDDRSYQQLLFTPYRVMLVAPRSAP